MRAKSSIVFPKKKKKKKALRMNQQILLENRLSKERENLAVGRLLA